MKMGSEVDGFQVWKFRKPVSLMGVMKEVIQGQGQGLMTSEFEHGSKVLGISEILWK